MSRTMVLVVTALSLVLVAGLTYAQQTAQPGQQQPYSQGQSGAQGQSGSQGMGGSAGAWNSPQRVQRLSQAVNQSDADLEKAINTATGQAKGTVVGAAFVLPQSAGGAAGGSSGQSQDLVAHVYVVADNNQLKDVIVDVKNNKVLSAESREMVSNPWTHRESMEGGMQGQGGSQGQASTPRERVGMPSDISFLKLDTAQRLVRLAQQDNITLQKAISTAESQAQGAKVVGAFLVLPQQANLGAAGQQSTAGQQANLYAKIFAVTDNNQVKVMTIDAKSDKILSTETRQTFVSPYEGRTGSMGTGGTSGMQRGQSGQQGSSGSESGGEQFPTGSSSGSGAGSLGGQ